MTRFIGNERGGAERLRPSRGTRLAGRSGFAVRLAFIAALSLGLSLPALADDDEDYDDTYSRNAVSTIFTGVLGVATFSDLGPLDVEDVSTWGVNARLNYRFMRWLSAEIQYEWVDGWTLQNSSGDFESISRVNSGHANLKGYIMTHRLQPYGLLGVGATSMRFKNELTGDAERFTDFSMRFGAGLDYYVSDGFGLNLESVFVQPLGGDLTDYHYLTINWGFFLRF